MNPQQENDSFRAESSIELGNGTGMDYTKDFIYGSDQSQYAEPEEAGEEIEG
ncbi:hypothetical protein WMW72_31860 [Paenibacillus filicis]|uniref:DUF4025 domain-containing protein n=1 Tax=Paenibacillus filicis TaxID=669464 RepID=A0ABU9DUE7_9BACL